MNEIYHFNDLLILWNMLNARASKDTIVQTFHVILVKFISLKKTETILYHCNLHMHAVFCIGMQFTAQFSPLTFFHV